MNRLQARVHQLEAFIRLGGFQCGICTPGQIMAATALLEENPKPTEAEIKDWMMGNLYINQNRFGPADAELRAALPMLRHSEQSAAPILFYLGWSNYKLENYAEAVRFFKQCMAIQSQYHEQAEKNLGVIKNEQGIQ